MQKYKTYKPTRLEWIGDIPTQWNAVPLKYIASIAKGKKPKEDFQDYASGLIPYLSMEYLRNQTENPTYVQADDDSIVLVDESDLLILWDGSKAGEIVKAKRGALSSTMGKIHIEDNSIALNYLNYFLKSAEPFLQSNTIGMGIPHVDGEVLRDLLIAKPSIEEQNQIAKYLDYQISLIDDLIFRKEKLVQLLKEKKESVINESVINGLSKTSRKKQSGFDWIGEIPESWETIYLRHLTTKIGSGVTPKGGAEVYTEEGVIFIRSQNVHFDGLRLDDVVRIDFDTHEKMSSSRVQYKDVLLNITGASIGRCCVVDIQEEMNVNQHVCIIRANEKIAPEYLNLVLKSSIGQIQVKLGTTGGNREGLTFEAIKDFIIPIPSFSEQLQIVNNILESVKKFEKVEIKNVIQIERLKEYRQSLITEVVTGKIDVRDWQPNKKQVA